MNTFDDARKGRRDRGFRVGCEGHSAREDQLGPGVDELRDHPGLGKHLVKAGREIHVWTVNTAEDLQICLDLGVTAVISDRPAHMLELLGD